MGETEVPLVLHLFFLPSSKDKYIPEILSNRQFPSPRIRAYFFSNPIPFSSNQSGSWMTNFLPCRDFHSGVPGIKPELRAPNLDQISCPSGVTLKAAKRIAALGWRAPFTTAFRSVLTMMGATLTNSTGAPFSFR